jgi:hypothetical protein
VNVTETPVLDRTMEIGAQTEQVTVEANAELLKTSESTLGRVVDSATLSNQPLATRNYTSIMGLEAGAAGGVGNATTLGKATADIAVNGAGLDQNNIMMDGATIVNAFGAGNNADSGIYVGVAIANPDFNPGIQGPDLDVRRELRPQSRSERQHHYQVGEQSISRISL